MTQQLPGHNLYLNFDSLYDTRLGTVALIDDAIAEQLINDDNYRIRISDEFSYIVPGWDDKLFAAEYAKRDIATLLLAPMTELLMQFNKVIEEASSSYAVILGEEVERPVVYVNIHPYVLTEAEIEDFRLSIQAQAGGHFEYIMINEPPEVITMRWLERHQIGLGWIYDWQEWDQHCISDVTPDTIPIIPQTNIVFCKRFISRELARQVVMYQGTNGERADPYEAHTFIRASFIGIRWNNSDIFSAANIKKHLT